jgi:hypothetical protein
MCDIYGTKIKLTDLQTHNFTTDFVAGFVSNVLPCILIRKSYKDNLICWIFGFHSENLKTKITSIWNVALCSSEKVNRSIFWRNVLVSQVIGKHGATSSNLKL